MLYLLWGLLYLSLGVYSFAGHRIHPFFGEIIFFDMLTNFLSPFVYFGVLLTTAAWQTRKSGKSPAMVVFAFLFAFLFWGIPITVVFNAVGWGMTAGLIFFFIKLDWLKILNSEPRMLRIFVTRVVIGPLLCAAPGYVTTRVLGQDTFDLSETSWAPAFGAFYFALQGAIEEFSLRWANRRRMPL